MTAPGDASADTMRILIVDAYRHSREGLSSSLRGEACVVETATSGWDAISKIKDRPFEMAVIDLELPPAHGVTFTGWEVAQVFRAFQPGAAVVLVTSDWQAELKARMQPLERFHLIEKPINTAELREIVGRLRRERAARHRGDAERTGRR